MRDLTGKTALVTGGSKRIGQAISLALAKAGVNVAVHYPEQSGETDEVMALLAAYPVSAWTVKADFLNPQEYKTLVARTVELTGQLDIVINNASIFSGDTLDEIDLSQVVRHLEVNAWVPFELMRAFAHRAPEGGHVINILDSKIAGYDWPHISYILSKQQLSLLTMMAALKYAPRVSVNAIAPGLILPPAGKDEAYLDGLAGTVPLQRHGGPDDITAAVLYLLRNDFMTGQVLFVDGGRHLRTD